MQTRAYTLEYRAGTPEGQHFSEDMQRAICVARVCRRLHARPRWRPRPSGRSVRVVSARLAGALLAYRPVLVPASCAPLCAWLPRALRALLVPSLCAPRRPLGCSSGSRIAALSLDSTHLGLPQVSAWSDQAG